MSSAQFSQQITFLHSQDLQATRQFYEGALELTLVRDQRSCLIFKVTHQAYLGFCEQIEPISPGRRVILTLVSEEVDGWYQKLKHKGVTILGHPQHNPNFKIYHFFFNDPDGYEIEIQRFDQPL